MAEGHEDKIMMSCESSIVLQEMLKQDFKKYSEFLMDHTKRIEGLVFPCSHRNDIHNCFEALIELLKKMAPLAVDHVHVADETRSRASCRRNELIINQQVDSGTGSIQGSQEISNCNVSRYGRVFPEEAETNYTRPQFMPKYDDNYSDNRQQEEIDELRGTLENTSINRNSQTDVKAVVRFEESPHDPHSKDSNV
jgi:hypothetical protein